MTNFCAVYNAQVLLKHIYVNIGDGSVAALRDVAVAMVPPRGLPVRQALFTELMLMLSAWAKFRTLTTPRPNISPVKPIRTGKESPLSIYNLALLLATCDT